MSATSRGILPAADGRRLLADLLAAALVLVSIGWVVDVPGALGRAFFAEQPLALALGLALAVGCLAASEARPEWGLRLVGALGAAVLLAGLTVIAWRFPQLQILAMMRPVWLALLSVVVILGTLALVWRQFGPTIVIIVAGFSALALWGGALDIPTTAPDRWAIYMLTDANAILGIPLKVAVQIVIPFVLFGELLRLTGGGAYMTRLCLSLFGRYRGGSAKAAIGASAVFGTISGNAVSNVAGTGVVTIPLMVRTGLPRATACAVEAAASTGGQLLPPVMGAAAFVMADYLRVPYIEVAAAATLPALLYFAALLMQVDRLAAKHGLSAIPISERLDLAVAARGGAHFAIPFVLLFVVLWQNQTRPELAAIAASIALAAVCVLRPYEGHRLTLHVLLAALVAAGRAAAPLLLITAAAGMIIGLVSLTGLGFSIAADAIAASGGSLLLLLILVAVIAIVFGMGMPTVAVYVVLATILAPALVDMGLSGLQAHLFILYFGMMSMLTPPVALASITAARIGGADIWSTSFRAVRLAWPAYIIPVLFAFSPDLLLRGSPMASAIAAITALLGTGAISVAAAGYGRGPLGPAARGAFVLAGAGLLVPPSLGPWALAANLAGAAVLATLFVASSQRGKSPRDHHAPTVSSAGPGE